MPQKWDKITKADAIEAMRRYDLNPDQYTKAKHTFVIHNQKHYPAKAVRGIAYEVCFGEKISQSAFTGGKETARFFERLGFDVSCGSSSVPDYQQTRNPKIRKKLGKVRQKNALQVLLQKHFGIIVSEKAFDWLCVPGQLSGTYSSIYDALCAYRGNENFIRYGRHLSADFYIESLNLVIEYDEDQHFSLARRIALKCYPSDLQVGFSVKRWIDLCTKIKASDNNPVSRDETRAFYDAVRDIEITRNGVRLIRIHHGDIDWEADDADSRLLDILKPYLSNSNSKLNMIADTSNELSSTEWRRLEINIQRIRLNYLKWLFHFVPPEQNPLQISDHADSFGLIETPNGRCFTWLPCGLGSVYVGGGRGQVKLPSSCFIDCSELREETQYLKDSLASSTRMVRNHVERALQNNDIHKVWQMLLEYWWIKLGFHEYTHDVAHEVDFEIKGIRDYIVAAMRCGFTADNINISLFSKNDISYFVRHRMKWNRYACCSFECGPIAIGRSRYVPYEEISIARQKYFSRRQLSDTSDSSKRLIARQSLNDIYDFLLLYYEKPISLANDYRGFQEHKHEINEVIRVIQEILNKTIMEENLDLPTFSYVPE